MPALSCNQVSNAWSEAKSCVGRRGAVSHHVFEDRLPQQINTETHGRAKTLPVPGMRQEAIVQMRLHCGVGGRQPDFSSAHGQLQSDPEAHILGGSPTGPEDVG